MVTRSVLKFGGSSVSDFTKIKRIAEMLKERVNQDEQLIVVVSAMGNTTDQLMTNVSTLTKTPKQQELALLLTTGEQQTVSYLSMVLNDIGVNAKAMTGYQAGIKTIGHHLKSKIAQINPQTFEQAFQENDILVVAGFQGINEHQELTTLGRGVLIRPLWHLLLVIKYLVKFIPTLMVCMPLTQDFYQKLND